MYLPLEDNLEYGRNYSMEVHFPKTPKWALEVPVTGELAQIKRNIGALLVKAKTWGINDTYAIVYHLAATEAKVTHNEVFSCVQAVCPYAMMIELEDIGEVDPMIDYPDWLEALGDMLKNWKLVIGAIIVSLFLIAVIKWR